MSWDIALQSSPKGKKNKLDFDFRLSMPSDRIIGITGPSGAGKTTLTRLLSGLDESATGELRYKGTVLQSQQSIMPTRKRSIGCVFQHENLFPHKTIALNLRFAKAIARRRNRIKEDSQSFLDSIIEQLSIAPWLHKRPHELSGGEKQLVALARAIAAEPDALILDEAFSGMDRSIKQTAFEVVRRYHQRSKSSVLFVSHHLNELGELAQDIVNIDKGRVSFYGDVKQFMSSLGKQAQFEKQKYTALWGRIEAFDPKYKLWTINVDEQLILVPAPADSFSPGQNTSILIDPRNVSVSMSNFDSSILNNFKVSLLNSTPHNDYQQLLTMQLKQQTLHALITQ